MYRYVDLRPDIPKIDDDPENNPDSGTQAKYFAFLHGYNVTKSKARGWNAEVFKRLHSLGFNGRFIGMTWPGDTNPDYHDAVYLAFSKSEAYKSTLKNIANGRPLTIAGHSLGNMVASNAISEFDLKPDHYYIINGAVPIEAYDTAESEGDGNRAMRKRMTEKDWYEYPEALYAANWHKVFDYDGSNDPRKDITWSGRFSTVLDYAYNFYSEGDDVVEEARLNEEFGSIVYDAAITALKNWDLGDAGRHAWVTQEIAKGGQNILTLFAFSKRQAGWAFNRNRDDLVYISEANGTKMEGDEATLALKNGEITDEHIAQFGYFRRFDKKYRDLYAPIEEGEEIRASGTPTINDVETLLDDKKLSGKQVVWRLLGHAIPAQSDAVAVNIIKELVDEKRNFHMPEESALNKQGWTDERMNDDVTERRTQWLHSDFRNVAMPFVYPVYEKMLSIAELTMEKN
jgi:hypothetical protein